MRAAGAASEEQFARMRLHAIAKCIAVGVPAEDVVHACGALPADARLWRLIARGMEASGRPAAAAVTWMLFREKALTEKTVDANSPEEAAIHLRAARLLARIAPEPGYVDPRQDALEEIAYAAAELSGRKRIMPVSRQWADPAWHFDRAAAIRPDSQVFKEWWTYETGYNAEGGNKELQKRKERLAETWAQRVPSDPRPLIELAFMAEDRDALKKGLGYLSRAEALDAMTRGAQGAPAADDGHRLAPFQ